METNSAISPHVDNGVLVVDRPNNGLARHFPDQGQQQQQQQQQDPSQTTMTLLRDVTVWMGQMANCGEDDTSRLVRDHCQTLQRFVYLPYRTKGGRMVRPHYYRSDRSTPMEFPNLTMLGYWEDCRTPNHVKWIVPNLQTLLVCCLEQNVETMLNHHWRVNDDETSTEIDFSALGSHDHLPERAALQCPLLREIICAVVETTAPPNTWKVVRRLKPPQPLPWNKLRLLHLAMTETEKSKQDEVCLWRQLPEAVVHRIVAFCHQPRWKVQDYGMDTTGEETTRALIPSLNKDTH